MKESIKNPEKKQGYKPNSPEVSKQGSISEFLQACENGTLGRRADVVLQAKSLGNDSIGAVLQRYEEHIMQREEPIQGKWDLVQRESHEGKKSQGSLMNGENKATVQKKENQTGLPDNLKSGVESLSGFSMDDVRVHYNSSKPAQIQAMAYTHGADIHVAPGQEKHLSHEAWHVVQQIQGRVQPTIQMQGLNVNDNEGLEREADVMGSQSESFNKTLDHQLSYKSINNTHVQGYFKRKYAQWWRISDDKTMRNLQESNSGSKTLYAKAGKAAASNNILKKIGSQIELIEKSEVKYNLKKIEAKNKYKSHKKGKGTQGDNMKLWADCGKANASVVGSDNRKVIHKINLDTNSTIYNKLSSAPFKLDNYDKGHPNGMKIEIIQRYMISVYEEKKESIDSILNTLESQHKKYSNGEINEDELSESYISWYEKNKDDLALGINEYANPSVGQGYTTSTGGKDMPGYEDNTWNFHWGGVIMESDDKKDKVVLENYAAKDPDEENTNWKFQMYGTEKKGQSFHEQHKATNLHGDSPTTMVIEKE